LNIIKPNHWHYHWKNNYIYIFNDNPNLNLKGKFQFKTITWIEIFWLTLKHYEPQIKNILDHKSYFLFTISKKILSIVKYIKEL